MPFQRVECVQPFCDDCGGALELDYEVHYPTEADALDALDDAEWVKTPDGKLHCSECRYESESVAAMEAARG